VYAQIDESRARVLLAEGKTRQAFESALASVLALKDEDEQRLLLESLETLAAIADAFKKEREREEICLALLNSDGRIKQAARLLGLKHQTLAWKLEHQYPQLLDLRAPKKKPRGLHAAKA
jgi:transcriptional regulator of acetoin/glycerol metabolism